jgi:endoglucanase
MLLACWCGDRGNFERLLDWTDQHLNLRGDPLFAWRYRHQDAQPVPDRNNATDGDIMIAWALLLAGAKWGQPTWSRRGRDMARTIRQHLVFSCAERMVLLPGMYGFRNASRIVVNPSYYIMPALHAFAAADPDPVWPRLIRDGQILLSDARFGPWRLPADWVDLPIHGGRPTPAIGWPARFSWNAVRVPLHLVWAGEAQHPAVRGAAAWWRSQGDSIAVGTELLGEAPALERATPGVQAIAALTIASEAGLAGSEDGAVEPAYHYFDAALLLLARLAQATQAAPACTTGA